MQYYPTVTSVSIAEGSRAGGAVVEILGTGFDEHMEHNEVTIQGRPCVVTLSSMERILCNAPAEDPASADPAVVGQALGEAEAVVVDDSDCAEHPGMREMAGAQSVGGSFLADGGSNKGKAWLGTNRW